MIHTLTYSIIAILLLGCIGTSSAQTFEYKDRLYRHEFSAGLTLRTNSYGLHAEKVWIKNIYSKRLLQLEMLLHYDSRQKKLEGSTIGDRTYRKYYYGKINDFFALKLNYGYRKTIAERAMQKSGVAVYFTYTAGFNLGIEKPYFLYLRDIDNINSVRAESYSNDNKDRFLNNSPTNGQIVGFAGADKGWSNIKPLFGGNIKLGLHFDWAKQSEFIKALEVGFQFDVYHRPINFMAGKNNKPYLLAAYLNFQLGKRW